jgi:hypothetical protein
MCTTEGKSKWLSRIAVHTNIVGAPMLWVPHVSLSLRDVGVSADSRGGCLYVALALDGSCVMRPE